MNKKAQFGFGFEPKQKKRVTPTKSEKNEVWDRQNGNCYVCGKKLSPTTSEYHHKDGDRSNWRLSNIALVCSECHKKETNKQRVKKVQEKRREHEAKESNPLGFGGGLFGSPNPRMTKKPDLFGGGDIFGAPKKSRKKKGLFDL
jgi:hypothetical protein